MPILRAAFATEATLLDEITRMFVGVVSSTREQLIKFGEFKSYSDEQSSFET
jgi:hypothetical protein